MMFHIMADVIIEFRGLCYTFLLELRHPPIHSQERRNTTEKTKRSVNPQVPGSSPGRGTTLGGGGGKIRL